MRSDSLSCVIIADMDYPVRVIFTLMNKVRFVLCKLYRRGICIFVENDLERIFMHCSSIILLHCKAVIIIVELVLRLCIHS